MIPWEKLKTAPVTTSQEPQISTAARRPSVRRVRHRPTISTAQKNKCCRQEPRDLRPHLGTEEARDAGRAPHAAARRATTAESGLAERAAADDAAGLGARQAAEAVVTEDQVENRVVLRPSDVGPARG